MKSQWSVLAAASLMGLATTVAAQDGTNPSEGFFSAPRTVGVSLDASILLGAGVSVGVPLGDRFNLRGVYHGFSYDREIEDEENNATYDGDLRLQSYGLKADWHPFKGTFRVTAGFLSNGNEIRVTAQDTGGQVTVDNCTYQSDPNDPLAVDGLLDFRSSAPYLGIGWGGNLNGGKGFYGVFDIGVMFSGAAKAALDGRGKYVATSGPAECGTANGSADDPEFQEALARAEDDLRRETEDYKLWPNIAFGIGWRF
jgi:hypothetical protein